MRYSAVAFLFVLLQYQFMEVEIKLTEDGSHTLFVPAIDECYHSSHGAVQESRHIFIDAALRCCTQSDIVVLEIGFGTGLNALLALAEAEQTCKRIRYISLEKFPVAVEQALELNYPQQIGIDAELFCSLHTAPWNVAVAVTPHFTLQKMEADFCCFEHQAAYDVVFFDAFSPDKQPEMWSQAQFERIFAACNAGALLTTYCAKGVVRRAMQAAGFLVERLPGPPGKREMLRARKN